MFYDDSQLGSDDTLNKIATEFEKKIAEQVMATDSFFVKNDENFFEEYLNDEFYDDDGNPVTIAQQAKKLYDLILQSEANLLNIKQAVSKHRSLSLHALPRNNELLEKIKLQKQTLKNEFLQDHQQALNSLSVQSDGTVKINNVQVAHCIGCETDILKLVLWFMLLQNLQQPRRYQPPQFNTPENINNTPRQNDSYYLPENEQPVTPKTPGEVLNDKFKNKNKFLRNAANNTTAQPPNRRYESILPDQDPEEVELQPLPNFGEEFEQHLLDRHQNNSPKTGSPTGSTKPLMPPDNEQLNRRYESILPLPTPPNKTTILSAKNSTSQNKKTNKLMFFKSMAETHLSVINYLKNLL